MAPNETSVIYMKEEILTSVETLMNARIPTRDGIVTEVDHLDLVAIKRNKVAVAYF